MRTKAKDKEHHRILKGFWSNFGGRKNCGEGYDKEMKLQKLREVSEIVIHWQKTEKRRTKFQKVRNKRHSLQNNCVCFVCGSMAECRHHIVQLKHGGHNGADNLVSLCNHCHCDIHPWMERPKDKPVTKTLAAFCDSLDM